MNSELYRDSMEILHYAIEAVKPDSAVKRAIERMTFTGRLIVIAVGKAAWQMAKAASDTLNYPIQHGIVITKYGHVCGPINGIECFEAGHPIPDENSFSATEKVLEITKGLSKEDTVLFLLSGGGSALFESPLITGEEMSAITDYMLKAGMNITEMNCIRKRLSKVKGGKFALWCSPAKIESIILSDIVGDPLDMIASGPCAIDSTTCEDALNICEKYNIPLSADALWAVKAETPKKLDNVSNQINGSVRELCRAAAEKAAALGYKPVFLGDSFTCEADELGERFARELLSRKGQHRICLIGGGETVVHVKGTGLGGRNQQTALTASKFIAGQSNISVASIGSDGTDGPTDAAGGYVDGDTVHALNQQGLNVNDILENNDAYNGLKAAGGLIKTGPTGTNVNDVTIGLIG